MKCLRKNIEILTPKKLFQAFYSSNLGLTFLGLEYFFASIFCWEICRGAKQRRGGLAPLSAPEQILRGLAREQRHLAYLDCGIFGA